MMINGWKRQLLEEASDLFESVQGKHKQQSNPQERSIDFSKILKAYHRGIFRDLPIPMHKSVSTKNQALQTIPVSKL
ncbi:MAG: hypothetical protein MJA27_34995 [Pseudanabaenales cyanobacterium]|nr:hypothetical protein [Pseudanabaenales cyanobacterium]